MQLPVKADARQCSGRRGSNNTAARRRAPAAADAARRAAARWRGAGAVGHCTHRVLRRRSAAARRRRRGAGARCPAHCGVGSATKALPAGAGAQALALAAGGAGRGVGKSSPPPLQKHASAHATGSPARRRWRGRRRPRGAAGHAAEWRWRRAADPRLRARVSNEHEKENQKLQPRGVAAQRRRGTPARGGEGVGSRPAAVGFVPPWRRPAHCGEVWEGGGEQTTETVCCGLGVDGLVHCKLKLGPARNATWPPQLGRSNFDVRGPHWFWSPSRWCN